MRIAYLQACWAIGQNIQFSEIIRFIVKINHKRDILTRKEQVRSRKKNTEPSIRVRYIGLNQQM
jgi:hypothetical protein